MGSLKQLASQTLWYGVSNIAARLLTYLLTPYLTYTLTSDAGQVVFGQQGYIYSIIPLMNTLYTYGMETSFFRFSTTEDKTKLYRTQMTSMLISSLFFSALLWIFRKPVAEFAELGTYTEYVGWCAAIIGLDALSALPYARLRKDNRPRKYAFTKILGIVVFITTIVFLFSFGDDVRNANPASAFARWYDHHWGIGFILFANVLQAIVTLLLLSKELTDFRPAIDKTLLKKVLAYGLPILVAGFAGNINDSLNRVMFQHLNNASSEESLKQLGYFTAAIRLAVFINLANQAFRMAAEPFFFSISQQGNAKATYARVMKWFVIIMGVMFLNILLFMDVWKYFVAEEFRTAFHLVPVLLMSYIFFGIYSNLTVWYKLTDKTYYGTYIMLIGAVFTIVFNWLLIPTWGFNACAWGMLLCNVIMVLFSYAWGQRFYPVDYNVKHIAGYIFVMLLLFAIQFGIGSFIPHASLRLVIGVVLFAAYFAYVYKQERSELKSFPIVGKFVK